LTPSDTPLDRCELDIRVRYFECDPMGYLHHARYLEFFELGRTDLLRRSGHSYREMEQRGHYLVVARAQCKFIKPARYDDVLTLSTRIERVTSSRIDHTYELRRGDTLLCLGQTTLASVDGEGKLACIPEYLKPSIDVSG
jgi:acyl-CoA thioester hydrolase